MTNPASIQTRNRNHVSPVRLSIRNRQASTARAGSTGLNGTRKARGRSGRVRRRMMTPIETSMKANNVPMLTNSASASSGMKPAKIVTTTPTPIVIRYGVTHVGWTLASPTGNSRSRLMANGTRDCPSIRISMTEVSPATAPNEMRWRRRAGRRSGMPRPGAHPG